MPENGARIVFRSIAARISPTRASVCRLLGRRPIELGLRDDALVRAGPASGRSSGRASSRCASTAASCARSCRVSSCTSTSPSRTDCPESNAIRSTVPGQIGADRHALHRRHRADGLERRRPLFLRRDDRRHGFGRRLKAAPCAIAVWICLNFTKPERRDERSRHGQHQNHSLRHDASSRVDARCSDVLRRRCRSRSRVRVAQSGRSAIWRSQREREARSATSADETDLRLWTMRPPCGSCMADAGASAVDASRLDDTVG